MSEYSGSYEWHLRKFLALGRDKQLSETFTIGTYLWQLECFPICPTPPNDYVSVYLRYPKAYDTPSVRSPKASFSLVIKNHKDPGMDLVKDAKTTFDMDHEDWGFSRMLPRSDATVEAGYLREDGVMVIQANIKVSVDAKTPLVFVPEDVASDFLALLEQPGGTSDLTLAAGGRSFAVHRAILAARCEFFKTMFTSGFADSTANEVPLPDADPDALAFLLRYIYGGVLDSCPRQVLKPAIELADRLLLRRASIELGTQLVETTDATCFVSNTLWAAETGREALLERLEMLHLPLARQLNEDDLAPLAQSNPKLLVRLFCKLASLLSPP